MSARYLSSKLIKNSRKGAKSVAVGYVDKTTSWTRPKGFPSTSVKSDFTQIAEENIDSLKPETAKVAMKESENQSNKDRPMHYTAFELDKDDNVVGTRHYVKRERSEKLSLTAVAPEVAFVDVDHDEYPPPLDFRLEGFT